MVSFARQPLEYLGEYLGRKALRALEGGTIASMAVKGAGTDGANAVKNVLSHVTADPIGSAGHLVDKTGDLARYAVGQSFDAFQRSGQTVLSQPQLAGVKAIAQDIPTHIKAAANGIGTLDGSTIKTFLQGEVTRGQVMADAIKAGIPVKDIFNADALRTKAGNFITGLKQGVTNVKIPDLGLQPKLHTAQEAIQNVRIPDLGLQQKLHSAQEAVQGIKVPNLHINDTINSAREAWINGATNLDNTIHNAGTSVQGTLNHLGSQAVDLWQQIPINNPPVDLHALAHPLNTIAQLPGVEQVAHHATNIGHTVTSALG